MRVPIGRREMIGYCVGFAEAPDVDAARVKDIQAVLDGYVSVTPVHLDLTNYVALEYLRKNWLQ